MGYYEATNEGGWWSCPHCYGTINALEGVKKPTESLQVTDEMVERAVDSRYPLLISGTLAQYQRRYDNYGEEARAIHQARAKAEMRAVLEAALTEGKKP